MSPIAQAIFGSWSIDPKLASALVISALLYLRGWLILRRIAPRRFPVWRLGAFLGGLAVLWIAIASPLDAFSGLLLSVHMIQHLLLMYAAAPLILLGAPMLPLLRGLPRTLAHDGLGPFLSWPRLRRFGDWLTHPIVCWLAMAISLCAWHVPLAFEHALRLPAWHKVEHACFLATALLFWWPVVRPFPSRPYWPLWTVPIYLLAADLLNTALCAILTFSEHVLYPTYATVPRLFDTTALSDQAAAGVIMWVPGSLVFLIPATVLAIRYLSPDHSLVRPIKAGTAPSISSRARPDVVARVPFDLLTMPVIGPFLSARHGRRILQAVLLVISIVVIADGLFGPQTSSANLAGVLPWTYWRALTVVALLAVGNLFCMACPFMLPRELGRRLGLEPHVWPRALRSKWLAVGLLVLFFWAYEAFGLWDKPAGTAWIIIGYFLAAFLVDAFFRKASFCKYVCPIGQFHFINSLISPLEVKVREPDVCAGCKTHDCLRGNEHQRGCETSLYLPHKAGSMDCTFCLDCVHACPHDNIGLQVVMPGAELIRDPRRSSLGRLSRRIDVAALALVIVFAAFAGAAAMISPVTGCLDGLTSQWGMASPIPAVTLFFVIALVLVPTSAMGTAVWLGRSSAQVATPIRELFCRFSLALVPLGAAMWAAHFLFHLLVGYDSVVPVLQRVAGALGFQLLGNPNWAMSGLRLNANTIIVLQTLLLDAGLLLTLYVGWRIARECVPRVRTALGLFVPWVCVVLGLYVIGIWIFLQPMQMRGMMSGAM